MVISCRFLLSFDAIMRNYTVYDGLTNWNFAKKTTWRPARSITLAACSANCLRVAANTRTKRDPPPRGQRGNKSPTLLSWKIYISIDFMLRPTTSHTSRKTGRFVLFFFKTCSGYHGVFAPEVTVESLYLSVIRRL